MNYVITEDRVSSLRNLRRHYGPATRRDAWERAKRIAAARKVSPQKVNWDFCLFVSDLKRKANESI